ncbi:MAG: TIGR01777 family oxidoreductase, partial [Archangium sp.]|nr:TIGR01777 family oxidoreductase [Archangium sp.]
GRMFRDEQRGGPFKTWVHTHRMEDLGGGQSALVDDVEYELPLGALGDVFGGGFARGKLDATFDYRHAVTRLDLERHARFAGQPRLTVAITGASGLVGTALSAFLSTGGHTVRAVKRVGDGFETSALEGADAIVHLAGAGIADERWTPARKQLLHESRGPMTRRLIASLRTLKQPPKTFISGSATGFYGDRGDEVLTEDSAPGPVGDDGDRFLSRVVIDWESAVQDASALGLREVRLRTGMVISARGGALAKMLPPFRAGVGGPVATGRQWTSWISIEDVLGVVLHALYTPSLHGAVNVVAPTPVTNADLTRSLGHVLRRPAVAPVPVVALRVLYGELAETLAGGQRVRPATLEASGFSFVHPTFEQALRFTLGRTA